METKIRILKVILNNKRTDGVELSQISYCNIYVVNFNFMLKTILSNVIKTVYGQF